ncbi:hypothetical protein [Nonomuraea endophytica]|uniref:hypothetical protein n=1 Tax=Nonomuraea endophytica TaxID=714136 RepID=UPI0037CA7DCD
MQFTTNPAEIFDNIERFNVAFSKAYSRMGTGRPTGLTVLGHAATGYNDVYASRVKDSKGELSDPSPAEVLITDEVKLKALPAECYATLGTGKNARKFTTYALIGAHVAAVLEFGPKTIESLGQVPGTSSTKVQALLLELPTMNTYRKEVEERRKAQAKATGDKQAVRLIVEHAARFGVVPEEKHFADVIKNRDLTWSAIQVLIAEVQGEPATDEE